MHCAVHLNKNSRSSEWLGKQTGRAHCGLCNDWMYNCGERNPEISLRCGAVEYQVLVHGLQLHPCCMPAVDQVHDCSGCEYRLLECFDFIGHDCILMSAFCFVNLWSWVLFCPCFVSLSADPIEDPWCWDRSLKKKTAANWNRPASEVQVADVCGVDSSFFNTCFCDNVLSYCGWENALFISIATGFLSFLFFGQVLRMLVRYLCWATQQTVYVYVCVHCITVRALDCRVVYRTEKSGLVKSRNSVIVTLERWRVRTSLLDLLASCSAVLTICFLFVGFQQSTAQSLALCRLWPFVNLDFLGCLLPS